MTVNLTNEQFSMILKAVEKNCDRWLGKQLEAENKTQKESFKRITEKYENLYDELYAMYIVNKN